VLIASFLIVGLALGVLLWGISLFLQGYLYQEPAEKLPLRALAAGLGVASYLMFWTLINTKADSPNKYGTFFEFNPTGTKEYEQFEAVRSYPNLPADQREKTVLFKKAPGAGNQLYLEAETQKPFKLNDSSYLTTAILITDGGAKTRFNALLQDGKVYSTSNKVFQEESGNRYLEGETPGTVYSPNMGVIVVALGLNLVLFLAWFVAFWPVLRFASGHALGLAVVFGLLTMLVLMPLLFRNFAKA
jgi:hypothetical protein